MPPYDRAQTTRRIFEAAATEFAAEGIAGARVDRIAQERGQQQGAHLQLLRQQGAAFATVLQSRLTDLANAVALDPDRVGDYVGELFDFMTSNPDVLRLVQHEASHFPVTEVPTASHAKPTTTRRSRPFRAAQAAGMVDATLDADFVVMNSSVVSWFRRRTPDHRHGRRRSERSGPTPPVPGAPGRDGKPDDHAPLTCALVVRWQDTQPTSPPQTSRRRILRAFVLVGTITGVRAVGDQCTHPSRGRVGRGSGYHVSGGGGTCRSRRGGGHPSACTLRVPLAAMGLTIVAAAPRTNDDAVGALLQVFGSAAGVVQIFAVAVAVAVAMRLIWVTLRDVRRGHGPSCPPVH